MFFILMAAIAAGLVTIAWMADVSWLRSLPFALIASAVGGACGYGVIKLLRW